MAEGNPFVAAFDKTARERADWANLQAKVTPEIKSLGEYRTKTLTGIAIAQKWLRQNSGVIPLLEQVTHAHQTIFDGVTIDAGRVRRVGEAVIFGGHFGADAQRIQIEYARLAVETRQMLSRAANELERCAAVAFYHARFVGIHPFNDGNGRLGRAVMMDQVQKVLGNPEPLFQRIVENKREYIEELDSAIRSNDLTGMTRLVAESVGLRIERDIRIEAPAIVASRPRSAFEYILPLEQELARAARAASRPLMTPLAERPTTRAATPAAVTIVEELTALRNEWPKAARTDQEKILEKALGIVNDTGGSGTTKIPLRVAAKDFVEGEATLDLLKKRATEHVAARTPGHVIEKGRGTGLSR
jgi:fido (protein-threonine AMPylation protein)